MPTNKIWYAKNCVECFQTEFLDPNYICIKSQTFEQFVSLFETTDYLYAGKAIRQSNQISVENKLKMSFCAYNFMYSVDQE